MTKSSDLLSGNFADDDTESWLTQLLAEEDGRDRNMLWRLGGWGVAAVSALTLGILATQFPFATLHLRETANADLAAKAQQVEWIAQQSQMETRRLAAVVATISTNRERLNDRVNAIEQGLESVTGALSRSDSAPPPTESPTANASPAAGSTAPPALTPVTAVASPSWTDQAAMALAKPDHPATEANPAASEAGTAAAPTSPVSVTKLPDVAAPEESTPEAPTDEAVPHTEFGLELGGANSLTALRALWTGMQKDHAAELRELRPIITVREHSNGLGMQLRLVAGPIKDAADATKICAALNTKQRECQTVVFEGQRLAMREPPRKKPARRKPAAARHPPAVAAATTPSPQPPQPQ